MFHVTGALMSVLNEKANYLDPGSGSFLIQLLIAGLATFAIVIGSQWARIRRWFGKNKAKPAEDEDDDDKEESNP